MRHGRHHPAVHEIQLSRQKRRRPAARAARGVSYRRQRTAGAGRGRYPEGRPIRQGRLFQADRIPAQRLSAEARRRCRQDQAGCRDDGGRQTPAVLYRRRRDQFRAGGVGKAARTGQAHRLSHHLDPDGARRISCRRSAMARHARHARHLGSELVDARLRPDDRGRLALRRPHYRPGRRLLAGLEENPYRHRSVLDQQERQGRSADRRRLRQRARRHAAAVARARPQNRQEGARGLVGADRQMAGEEIAVLHATRNRSSNRNMRSSASTN